MHYLPLGARLNKGILMVTQLKLDFFDSLYHRFTGGYDFK